MKTSCLSLAAGILFAAASTAVAAPVLLPVPADATASFAVWFDVGSQDDPPGKEGLAALTASMLAEGSTSRLAYDEIIKRLYPMAASYEATTDREMTVFSGRAHRDHAAAYLELYTDAFLHPAWKAEDFARLRGDALAALEHGLRTTSDEELGKAALLDLVYAGTPYAHPALGTVAALKAITLDDVKAFYARHYTRASAVAALGGGYSPEVQARLEAAIAALPPGDAAAHPPIHAPATSGWRALLVQKPGADASISFGFPIAVRRGERDFYALWLANSWLGEHRNSASHLYQVIREARGLNYGDYSYVEAFPRGGNLTFPPSSVGRHQQLFEVWIRTLPNAQAPFALRAALREVKHLVDEGLTEEQFQLTREFLSKYVLHFASTTRARLLYAIDDRFYGVAAPGHLQRFRDTLASLTRDEVNAAIRKHLRLDAVQIAIATGDAEGLKKALTGGAPTPIEYPSPKGAAILAEDKEIAAFPLPLAGAAVRIVPVEEMFEK